MKILLRVLLLTAILFSTAAAKNLDIFNTHKPFPAPLPLLDGKIVDLGGLEEEDLPRWIENYETARKSAASREEKNLLALAIGYMHVQSGEYADAIRYLKKNIFGNFILEDFRRHFLAHAYKELGILKLEEEKYAQAVEHFVQSERIRLHMFKSYPESPFYKQLAQDLAEIEELQGDAHSLLKNYKAAWRAYRRSLMREFPDNREHKQRVHLSLAKTYAAAGEIATAADIYASLLAKSHPDEVREAADEFLDKHAKDLKEQKTILAALAPPGSPESGEPPPLAPKPIARKPKELTYENETVRKFYRSLKKNNPMKSLKLGLEVLTYYPGIQEAHGVIESIDRIIVPYLKKHTLNATLHKITDLYPAKRLNNLAYSLWSSGRSDQAALFYQKILKQHPLETRACHKALFFLGRIFEDKKRYSDSLEFYRQLMEQYDYGPYTTATMFKIPWIERLQKDLSAAAANFEKLWKFYSSDAFRRLDASYPQNGSQKAATLFWLAQTEKEAGNRDKMRHWVDTLTEKYPFNFYAIYSHKDPGLEIRNYVMGKPSQKIASRYLGLGDIDRKRLTRAEKLIAVGFLDQGVEELDRISVRRENQPFLFYLAKLFHMGRNYQDSIRLSWEIAGNGNNGSLSRSLAEVLFPKAYIEPLNSTLKDYPLDPFLVLALMRQESAFNREVTSPANAVGLMQLMPRTAAQVARSLKQEIPTLDHLKDPETNIRLGVDYLNDLWTRFDQNIVYTLAGYNAGPNKVKQWVRIRGDLNPVEFMESIPYNETRNYVQKILRNHVIYLALYGGGEVNQKVKQIKEILTISFD